MSPVARRPSCLGRRVPAPRDPPDASGSARPLERVRPAVARDERLAAVHRVDEPRRVREGEITRRVTEDEPVLVLDLVHRQLLRAVAVTTFLYAPLFGTNSPSPSHTRPREHSRSGEASHPARGTGCARQQWHSEMAEDTFDICRVGKSDAFISQLFNIAWRKWKTTCLACP
jgi:hypothetical protein